VLASAVTRLLRERWLASSYKNVEHLVFCKTNGRGGDCRAAGEAFRAAVKTAGIGRTGCPAGLRAAVGQLRGSDELLTLAVEGNQRLLDEIHFSSLEQWRPLQWIHCTRASSAGNPATTATDPARTP
jgi:hypothetical protein